MQRKVRHLTETRARCAGCVQVCAQALFYTALWRPVDAEVEDLLSRGAAVRRPEGEPRDTVRPPCGYGLLQAREVARKVRALRSLMKVCHGGTGVEPELNLNHGRFWTISTVVARLGPVVLLVGP